MDLSETSMDRTVHTLMSNMALTTKSLDDLRGFLKETKEARINRTVRTVKAHKKIEK